MKPHRYYSVTGRIPDDENVTMIVKATDAEDADRQFRDHLWRNASAEEREAVARDWETDAYILSIVSSETEIREEEQP